MYGNGLNNVRLTSQILRTKLRNNNPYGRTEYYNYGNQGFSSGAKDQELFAKLWVLFLETVVIAGFAKPQVFPERVVIV